MSCKSCDMYRERGVAFCGDCGERLRLTDAETRLAEYFAESGDTKDELRYDLECLGMRFALPALDGQMTIDDVIDDVIDDAAESLDDLRDEGLA